MACLLMNNFAWAVWCVNLENKEQECVWAAFGVLCPSAFLVPFPGGFVVNRE